MAEPQLSVQEKSNFLSRLMDRFAHWSTRWVPDAMVFVLVLSVVVYVMALILTPSGPYQLIDYWSKGFWVLLTFAMQMTVLMITAFTVAESPQVSRALKRIAQWPKTALQAIIMFALICGVLWYIHWGIGMMASIILGREIAKNKRGLGIHYPFLVAIAYGMIVMANGPSMAAQLLLATPGHFMEKVTGVIPLKYTTFDIHLLVMNIVLMVAMPFLLWLIMPKGSNVSEVTDDILAQYGGQQENESTVDRKSLPPAQRWDRSPVFVYIVGIAGLIWIINFFRTKGIVNLDLNSLNFTFLILGMMLQRTPHDYIEAVKRATGNVYGVIIQFPFYAGIFGIINYSGLAKVIADWFVSISTPDNFPLIVYWYSALLNFFVPSGGSKFVIEAPYILPAAKQLGANVNYVVNAYTFGDLHTNLLQPFWALPILASFKLRFRDILPYGLVICGFTMVLTSLMIRYLPSLF